MDRSYQAHDTEIIVMTQIKDLMYSVRAKYREWANFVTRFGVQGLTTRPAFADSIARRQGQVVEVNIA